MKILSNVVLYIINVASTEVTKLFGLQVKQLSCYKKQQLKQFQY